jgi:hypothetical protein
MITSNHILGIRAKRREVIEVNDGYLFRERVVPYKPPFGFENKDIGLENTYYLSANAE